jgi:beta-lactam-binding protein with PASTA domain
VEQDVTERAVPYRVVRTVVFVAAVLLMVAVGIRVAVPRPPDVRGLTEQQAIRDLENAGYRVASAHFPVEEGDDFVECFVPSESAGVVIGQRPCPGLFSSAPGGSRVMVWIKVPESECVPPPGSVCAD